MLKLSQALSGWAPARGRGGGEPIVLLGAVWSDIVGTEVARHSRPSRIVDGTLQITTRSSAWSHQLSFLSEQIVEAIKGRLPRAGIQRIRFRIGALPSETPRPEAAHRRRAGTAQPLVPTESAKETVARFRGEVERRQRVARAAGWVECAQCGIHVDAGPICVRCACALAEERAAAAARLLCDAPWLGYAGTARLVAGLSEVEYERVRAQLLSRWWQTLARARAAGRISRNGAERLIASSYVLLRSKLPPEKIAPATVRSILGDDLHELLYGDVQH